MSKKKIKKEKLPKWLEASLKNFEAGRFSGPFDTVEELMASLESPENRSANLCSQ